MKPKMKLVAHGYAVLSRLGNACVLKHPAPCHRLLGTPKSCEKLVKSCESPHLARRKWEDMRRLGIRHSRKYTNVSIAILYLNPY